MSFVFQSSLLSKQKGILLKFPRYKGAHSRLDRQLHTLYRDAHIIVISKAAGILSQPDERSIGGATDLLGLVRAYIKKSAGKQNGAYVGLVHRLDRNVTGCMVFALRSKAAARLSYDFKNRLVRKMYVAMVVGTLSGEGLLTNSLVHGRNNVARVMNRVNESLQPPSVPSNKKLEQAQLYFKSLGTFYHPRGGAQTLLQIQLISGKKHQIRAQLSHLGHPIVGDVKYKAPTHFRDKFMALHCYSLILRHPSQGSRIVKELTSGEGVCGDPKGRKLDHEKRQIMDFYAPLPESWQARFGADVVRCVHELPRDIGDIALA